MLKDRPSLYVVETIVGPRPGQDAKIMGYVYFGAMFCKIVIDRSLNETIASAQVKNIH